MPHVGFVSGYAAGVRLDKGTYPTESEMGSSLQLTASKTGKMFRGAYHPDGSRSRGVEVGMVDAKKYVKISTIQALREDGCPNRTKLHCRFCKRCT